MFNTLKKTTIKESERNNFKELSILVKKAIGSNTISDFANQCNMPNSAKTIARIYHQKINIPPQAGLLKKIADGSNGRISVKEIFKTCNYDPNKIIDLKDIRVFRGWIVECNFGEKKDILGSEQWGRRPALVYQNNKGNYYSPNTFLIPITSQGKPNQCTHIEIGVEHGLKRKSIILVEQARTVSKERLIIDDNNFVDPICKCPKSILREVDVAFMKQTGIVNLKLNKYIVSNFLDKLDEYAEKVENGFSNNYAVNQHQQQYQPQPAYV